MMIVRPALLFATLALAAAPALAQQQSGVADPPPLPPAEDGVAVARPPLIQRAIPASPFTLDQRAGWLMQCRNTYLAAGVNFATAPGQLDLCETQLLDFERTYVPTGDGLPPVLWVRVPVRTEIVEAAPVEGEQDDSAE